MEVISSSMNLVNGFDQESWVTLQLDDSPSRCLANLNGDVQWVNSLDYPDLSANPSLILNDSVDFITSASLASPASTGSGHSGRTEPEIKTAAVDQKRPRVICPESDYNELGFLADLPKDTNVILQPSIEGRKPVGDSPFMEEFKKFLNGDLFPMQPASNPLPARLVVSKDFKPAVTSLPSNSSITPLAPTAPATTLAQGSGHTASAKVSTTNNNVPAPMPFHASPTPKTEPNTMTNAAGQMPDQFGNNSQVTRPVSKISYPVVQPVQKHLSTGRRTLASMNTAVDLPVSMSQVLAPSNNPSINGPPQSLVSDLKGSRPMVTSTPKVPDQYEASNSVPRTPSSTTKPKTASSSKQRQKRRRQNDDDDLDVLSTPVVGRRESSSRKAKENYSAKFSELDKVFDDLVDDNEKGPGMDFSDSDDDATWKPEKKRDAQFIGLGNISRTRHTSGAESTRKRSSTSLADKATLSPPSSKKSPSRNLSLPSSKETLPGTPHVKNVQDFKVGDFVVLKEDIGKNGMVIWKFDSKTLLQKFTPLPPSDGEILYQSANLFAGYVPWNRSKYASVSVSFPMKSQQKVKIVNIAKDESSVIKRKQSLKETAQCYEQFEVYLQALVSHSLDPDFLEEIFNDNDDYFIPKIKAVEEVTMKRKAILTKSFNWDQKFEQALDSWPKFAATHSVAAFTECEACKLRVGEVRVAVSGDPYDKTTLKPNLTVDKAIPSSFNVCKECCLAGNLYHRLAHLNHTLSLNGFKAIQELKSMNPGMDTAKLLALLLEKQSWVEDQFQRAQNLWAEADTFSL